MLNQHKRCWALSSKKYATEAIRNVKIWLEERDMILKTRVAGVLPSGYRPELDTSSYCDQEWQSFFQQQIGVLRWLVELGRIDITTEVSMLAAYLAGPREGHVHALLHVFAYINQYDRSRLVLDPSYIVHGEEPVADWSGFYPGEKEEIPPDAPEPHDKPVQMTVFVDSDHAGDLVTRRSRTGVLIFLNPSPITWYSKKQTSVETSTFGSEFMALKVGIEMVKGLRYKLRMLGVPLDGHAHIRVDNMSVVQNGTRPELTLRKKSNAIAYHFVRENVANGICRIAYEPSRMNFCPGILHECVHEGVFITLVEHICYEEVVSKIKHKIFGQGGNAMIVMQGLQLLLDVCQVGRLDNQDMFARNTRHGGILIVPITPLFQNDSFFLRLTFLCLML